MSNVILFPRKPEALLEPQPVSRNPDWPVGTKTQEEADILKRILERAEKLGW